jgi:chromosome segregation ATPase
MSSLEAEELIRLKLEIAQTRARTDTIRLQARQLISQRTTLRESAAKSRTEMEEQRLILAETMESINKLRRQLRKAEDERDKLIAKMGELED